MSSKKYRSDGDDDDKSVPASSSSPTPTSPSSSSSSSSSSSPTPPNQSITIMPLTGMVPRDKVFGARPLMESIMRFIDRSSDFIMHCHCRTWRDILKYSTILEPPVNSQRDIIRFRDRPSVYLFINDKLLTEMKSYYDITRRELLPLYSNVTNVVISEYKQIEPLIPLMESILKSNGGKLDNIVVDVIKLVKEYNIAAQKKNEESMDIDDVHEFIDPFGIHLTLINSFYFNWEDAPMINSKRMKAPDPILPHRMENWFGCTLHGGSRKSVCGHDNNHGDYPGQYQCTHVVSVLVYTPGLGDILQNTHCQATICANGYYDYWCRTENSRYLCPEHHEMVIEPDPTTK